MLEKYKESSVSVLEKAKTSNLKDCVLNLELSIHLDKEDLTSTLYCSCTKNSYEKFMHILPPSTLTEVIPDFTLLPGIECPELELHPIGSQENVTLSWTKPFYCIVIWASRSQSYSKLLQHVEEILQSHENIEVVSICIDENAESIIPNIQNFHAFGLSGISRQGIEVSEIPCFLLVKNTIIHSVLDLSHNLPKEISAMIDGRPRKILPNLGSTIKTLTLENTKLELDGSLWYLLIFPGSENEYFLRHLTQILDESPEIAEKTKVICINKTDLTSIELKSHPGEFFVIHNSVIVLRCDMTYTDIYHILKDLLFPKVFSRDEFLEKKSRFEYSTIEWQEKHPACPMPNVHFTFSKKIFLNSESHEEKRVRLEGKYLTVQKETIEEFYDILLSFFPIALNNIIYEAPSHTISPGEQCSVCDELLEKTHYLCVYCKPALYFCENCNHPHPVFRFTQDVAGLDHLTWGAFNFSVDRIDEGDRFDIICNLCKEKISGVRWKCAVCSDFDVCGMCLYEVRSHPKDHILIRILPQ
ncbi:hypothetical protein SteCoe_2863 [Stentor coeruleus]|uniref:ZZ-type domain-containing protein n=1 Tax=Stentor coeruleus TaxID=5963 RepID=A0A1R2CYK4_9CILI|nr:hypothetical protein SteCoe_2863 [Stentor coeruleus]